MIMREGAGMAYILIFFMSYITGSIPNGYLVGKLYGIDIRQFGSKNIGATNIYRTLGLRPAIGVFTTDLLKGIIGVYFGLWLLGTPISAIVGGIGAIIGHNWSMFLSFRGGRGVATGLGVIAVLLPKVTAIVFFIWLVIVCTTRYVSLGSIVGAVLAPILTWYFGQQIEYVCFTIVAALFVIVRHKPNIQRLLKGEELKIKAGDAANVQKEK
jgi:glycerol-3-phosphate acyltransferase PlsY